MPGLHPYSGRPDHQFWRKEPGIATPGAFDPVLHTSFRITPADPVVTAGSCFAQHVARHLANNGLNFLVTEPAHPAMDPGVSARFHYGLFSARYGNLYTARQLRQLLMRAYGQFVPTERSWASAGGSVVDPFRPQIQPGGFASERELLLEQHGHFRAIRTAIETMRVFVFTLGLTESWFDRRDGAVYPIAPGVAGGTYDPEIHGFHNFTVDETVADLQASIDFIRFRNPDACIILTVSPVPLNATAVDRHVFVSTTYSKAVLRVAAEQICAANALCDYFPSYEIITSPFARGAYYAADCREVLPAGVEHVMSLFLQHYCRPADADTDRVPDGPPPSAITAVAAPKPAPPPPSPAPPVASVPVDTGHLLEVLCDEEAITND